MVGTVSISPVSLVDGLSMVNYPGLVLLSVGVVSTSPVSFQVVVEEGLVIFPRDPDVRGA